MSFAGGENSHLWIAFPRNCLPFPYEKILWIAFPMNCLHLWIAFPFPPPPLKDITFIDNGLHGLINKFSKVSSFVLSSIISIVYGLISHSRIVSGFFYFAIIKAMRQDASNPWRSVFQRFYCSGTFRKCFPLLMEPYAMIQVSILLQPHRTVVASFVPTNFGLFLAEPWQPLNQNPSWRTLP